MGKKAHVPIEPDEQTQLANDTMNNVNGVVAAGIPGAGGYDALFVLYKKRGQQQNKQEGDEDNGEVVDEVRDEIAKFWMDWCEKKQKDGKRGVVCPLTSRFAGFGQGLHISKLEW